MQKINEQLRLLLSISFGIFLFVLFFQPFPVSRFDFNNSLIFIAGFGAIIFLSMVIGRVVFLYIFQKQIELNEYLYSYLTGFIILSLSSVALVFYLKYVGQVNISFYISIKVICICLVPPICLRIYDEIMDLRQINENHIIEKKIIQKQIDSLQEGNLNQSITFLSDNASEVITLQISEVVFIRSADNYVEIVYKTGDVIKKKLIRNTLRNIEQQTKPYAIFIRCHRICIVNIQFIEKLTKSYHNHQLVIRGYPEEIPVSRQYLLHLREAL